MKSKLLNIVSFLTYNIFIVLYVLGKNPTSLPWEFIVSLLPIAVTLVIPKKIAFGTLFIKFLVNIVVISYVYAASTFYRYIGNWVLLPINLFFLLISLTDIMEKTIQE